MLCRCVSYTAQLPPRERTAAQSAHAPKAELQRTRLIVMSNHPSPQIRKRCLELGSDYFFDKARDLDLLTAALNELLARGFANDER